MNLKFLKGKRTNSYSKNLEKSLKYGYREMSSVNLHLAEESVKSDNDALKLSEQSLRRVNRSDS